MRTFIIAILLCWTTAVARATMLPPKQTVFKAISAAQENDLESFVKYVRLPEVYSNNTRDFTPYKLLKILKTIDLEKATTQLQRKNIIILDDANQQIEFTVQFLANPNIRDDKQYAVSRVRIIPQQ